MWGYLWNAKNFGFGRMARFLAVDLLQAGGKPPGLSHSAKNRNILDETMDKHALNFVRNVIPQTAKYIICEPDISRNLKRNNF